MKRILSLLVVLAMVIAMVPSVFAADETIDMDELLGKLTVLDSIGEVPVSLPEGSEGKTYQWTPEEAGTLNIIASVETEEEVELKVTVQQGETVAELVDGSVSMEVVAGTEIVITVSEANQKAIEATLYGSVMPPVIWGTEGNPFFLEELVNNVTAEGTEESTATWYQGRFNGSVMTITGENKEFSIICEGETIAAVDGVITMPVQTMSPWMPLMFAIEQPGEYTIKFEYPEGAQQNPAALVLGANEANVTDTENGYFYNWTAEANGTLTITMPENNWSYVINNTTSYAYGEMQWSDSDPVVNPGTVNVQAGDVIEIIVNTNTFDPENPWGPPIPGTVTFTAAFEEAAYIVGDLDGNETVDQQDAIYLLRHVLFFGINGQYPVEQPVDYNHDDIVDQQDAIYLLRHVLFFGINGQYPLT